MKNAYTLVELIFVIVIIGILSGVGFYSFDPHYLRNDAHMIAMKIEQTRYQAIHFDKSFGEENSSIGCIDIVNLKNAQSTIDQNYKFHSDISPESGSICFDIFGRLSDESINDLNISYQNKKVTLHILKNSGYIDIIY